MGSSPGQHFVEHHAQGVNVRALVHVLRVLQLFGRHVVRRADGQAAGRQRDLVLGLAEQLGDAEVGDLHPALRVEQDVLRLDVAVQDAFVVGELERLANLRHEHHRLLRGEPARLHRLAQVYAVHELHQQVEEPAGLAEVMDGDDVRVVQPRQHAGLAVESLGEGGVGGQRLRQELERDEAVQLRLARLVHHPHAAVADEFEYLQLREGGGDRLRWAAAGSCPRAGRPRSAWRPRPAGISGKALAAHWPAAAPGTSGNDW